MCVQLKSSAYIIYHTEEAGHFKTKYKNKSWS